MSFRSRPGCSGPVSELSSEELAQSRDLVGVFQTGGFGRESAGRECKSKRGQVGEWGKQERNGVRKLQYELVWGDGAGERELEEGRAARGRTRRRRRGRA